MPSHVFQRITNFVGALAEMYAESNHDVAKYNYLLEQTNPGSTANAGAVERHITAFEQFFEENANELQTQTAPFASPLISYSDNIFIDMNEVLSNATINDTETIWKHLLLLWAFVDPASSARTTLQGYRDYLEEEKSRRDPLHDLRNDDSKEGEFMRNIIGEMGDSENEMGMITSLLNPQRMMSIVGQVASGEIDAKKLMGMTMGMVNKVQNSATPEDQEKMAASFANAQNMSAAMQNMSEGANPVDIQNAMQGIMGSVAESKDTPPVVERLD